MGSCYLISLYALLPFCRYFDYNSCLVCIIPDRMRYHTIYKERLIFLDYHFLVIKNNLCFAVNYDEDMIFAMCMISLRAAAAFFNIGDCTPFNFTILCRRIHKFVLFTR